MVSPRTQLLRCPTSAYDWEEERRTHKLSDDGTMTYFWRGHSVTVLTAFCLLLVCVAMSVQPHLNSTEYNIQLGVAFAAFTFLLVGVTQMPDGPFRRPHPSVWRLTLCMSILYELFLLFLMFQTASFARGLLKIVDSSLGRPLSEKSYGDQCVIYDTHMPGDPLHNVKAKMDLFVGVHFFGWFIKTLMLRDYWLCTVLSVLFELVEYSLEHQLPNFRECWWDHWIMDFLVCNGCGIYLGMKALDYLSMKPYQWRGLWNIPSYREKLQRLCAQFTPYSWTHFDWRPTTSLRRWLAMLGVITMFLAAEVNFFYLKFVLWVPPDHYLHLFRLILFIAMGSVAMRETFQYLDDPNYTQFGRQAWMASLIVITELLLITRMDPATISQPFPFHIKCAWVVALATLAVYTVWNFFLSAQYQVYKESLKVRREAAAAIHATEKASSQLKNQGDTGLPRQARTGRVTKQEAVSAAPGVAGDTEPLVEGAANGKPLPVSDAGAKPNVLATQLTAKKNLDAGEGPSERSEDTSVTLLSDDTAEVTSEVTMDTDSIGLEDRSSKGVARTIHQWESLAERNRKNPVARTGESARERPTSRSPRTTRSKGRSRSLVSSPSSGLKTSNQPKSQSKAKYRGNKKSSKKANTNLNRRRTYSRNVKKN